MHMMLVNAYEYVYVYVDITSALAGHADACATSIRIYHLWADF